MRKVTDDVCPSCDSMRTRRGGNAIWGVYVLAVLAAVPAVLLLRLNAAVVACALLVVIVVTHILLGTRVCLDCGAQWRG